MYGLTISYITPDQFIASTTGVETMRLPPSELAHYLARASDAVETYTRRRFDLVANQVETLLSGTGTRVVIDVKGDVLIYPIVRHPLNSVVSLSYATPGNSPIPVVTTGTNLLIVSNEWGDGEYVYCFGGTSKSRGPQNRLLWTITYSGGYAAGAYPDWLTAACIHWTAGLLLKRGAQAIGIEGSAGAVMDSSKLGSHIETAQSFLEPHVRRF